MLDNVTIKDKLKELQKKLEILRNSCINLTEVFIMSNKIDKLVAKKKNSKNRILH